MIKASNLDNKERCKELLLAQDHCKQSPRFKEIVAKKGQLLVVC